MPIVGVGASAGGVQALRAFFESMPAAPGAAFVVIVHLEPDSHSELPEILALRSRMPVQQVTERTVLRKNCIYVIPPDRELHLTDHEISVTPFTEPRGYRAPINRFFRSLAEQHGGGLAVILTGAGSDGAAGVKAIKEAGGIVFVQSPEEAENPSMPRSAIATEAADLILPVREIARQLTDILATRKHVSAVQKLGKSINEEYRSTAEELETSKEELQSINEELQTVNGELKLKLETVSRANSDLQNLMAATDFAALFLDPVFRIKRFTPKLADIFNITPNDVGRPIPILPTSSIMTVCRPMCAMCSSILRRSNGRSQTSRAAGILCASVLIVRWTTRSTALSRPSSM